MNKEPKTARGKKTLNKLLEAAEVEFGERGFHEAAISGITHRAGVALGTFYTYFDSKEAIFQALVSFMNQRTRAWIAERIVDAPDRLSAERMGLEAYIEFVREHRGIYRIITEAEFVANDAFRAHYEGFASAYQANLAKAGEKGDIMTGDYETWSWAIMGMAIFLGMRYADWDDDRPAAEVAETTIDLLTRGIRK